MKINKKYGEYAILSVKKCLAAPKCQSQERNRVKEFTVVADAGMISADNIRELTKESIHYIVRARLGNISAELLEPIDKSASQENAKSICLKTGMET